MSALTWILGGVALGVAGARLMNKTQASSPPAQNGTEIVDGRATYIYVPAGARRVVVYFHGFGGNVSTLGPRLAAAMTPTTRSILIAPQLGPKSEPGDLTTKFREYLSRALAKAGTNISIVTPIYVSHSGGYRATADAIAQVPPLSVVLLDSLYGRYEDFLAFGRTGKGLLDFYGPSTRLLSEKLREASVGRKNVVVKATSIAHDAIPAAYFGGLL